MFAITAHRRSQSNTRDGCTSARYEFDTPPAMPGRSKQVGGGEQVRRAVQDSCTPQRQRRPSIGSEATPLTSGISQSSSKMVD